MRALTAARTRDRRAPSRRRVQGGLFALYFGDQHPVDGIVAIAPGGNVASPSYREKLGDAVSRARQLAAAGKADEKTRLLDFEGSRGTYAIWCTPASYLSWFDPLRASRQMMFGALPRHPLSRLYEPDTNHFGAPAASIEEIARWTAQVAASGSASEARPAPR